MELVFEMRELEAAGDSAAGEITVSGPVPLVCLVITEINVQSNESLVFTRYEYFQG
jgi:hypothetical protein